MLCAHLPLSVSSSVLLFPLTPSRYTASDNQSASFNNLFPFTFSKGQQRGGKCLNICGLVLAQQVFPHVSLPCPTQD